MLFKEFRSLNVIFYHQDPLKGNKHTLVKEYAKYMLQKLNYSRFTPKSPTFRYFVPNFVAMTTEVGRR